MIEGGDQKWEREWWGVPASERDSKTEREREREREREEIWSCVSLPHIHLLTTSHPQNIHPSLCVSPECRNSGRIQLFINSNLNRSLWRQDTATQIDYGVSTIHFWFVKSTVCTLKNLRSKHENGWSILQLTGQQEFTSKAHITCSKELVWHCK